MKFYTIVKKIGWFFLFFFAIAGAILVVGFFAVKFGWTNTGGIVDFNDRYFKKVSDKILETNYLSDSDINQELGLAHCKWQIINHLYPETAKNLEASYETSSSTALLKLILATEVSIRDDQAYQAGVSYCEEVENKILNLKPTAKTEAFQKNAEDWSGTEEWQTFKSAIVKDQPIISKTALQVGVDPRLVVALLVSEQLRLFNSEREVYKQVFQPLKILGVQSKFSWGVMGLKEETATKIENNLKDSGSVFYLGDDYTHLLDFSSSDINGERFNRLTDEHNHYYSYLYSAIFVKQIINQWQRAGFDISKRPEIIATLFNLGFEKSIPKIDPQVGGAEIDIGDQKYSFGGLAFQFYYSGELTDLFPIKN